MKQNYLAILLHPAKAAPGVSGTGSSLASPLLAPQWGSRVILFPQHCEDSHRLSDSEKAELLPTANTSETWATACILQVGHFTNNKECELGLNMRGDETIFTNRQLTSREVKWFSQGKDKETVWCLFLYDSTSHAISSQCTGSGLGSQVLHF